jgi:hypothetical protein
MRKCMVLALIGIVFGSPCLFAIGLMLVTLHAQKYFETPQFST